MSEEELIQQLAEIAMKLGWSLAIHAEGEDVLGVTIGCVELLDTFDGNVDIWGKKPAAGLDS